MHLNEIWNRICWYRVSKSISCKIIISEHILTKFYSKVDALFAPIPHGDHPGASVIVIQDGRILRKKGYGMANLELGVSNTPQTKFRLATDKILPFTHLWRQR